MRHRAGELLAGQALALRTTVFRYATAVLENLGHPPLPPDPRLSGGVRTSVVGSDPVRVLLFGGDLAVGWGARSRDEALDGTLARALARATGRGVVLENRAVEHVQVADSAQALGATGLHTATFGVWCPSWTELLLHPSSRRWERGVRQMLAAVATAPAVPVVLLHMPGPSGLHPVALLARPWIQRFNRTLDRVADEHRHVVTLATAPIEARDAKDVVIGRPYYEALGADLSALLAQLLGGARAHSAA